MRKNVLFDLDGTLLPMDLPKFIELYLQAFCQRFARPTQLDPKLLVKGIWQGADAMAKNNGGCLNREVFWRALNEVCQRDMRPFEDDFDDFYRREFIAAKAACSPNELAPKTVAALKESGYRLIVATNPVFPKSATYARLGWAGLDPDDFDFITVYDNCSSSKPNLNYYHEICSICGIEPEECIMIGNDVDEDMCASKLGMSTFLVTDCLINRHEKDVSRYKHGTFEDLHNLLTHSI